MKNFVYLTINKLTKVLSRLNAARHTMVYKAIGSSKAGKAMALPVFH